METFETANSYINTKTSTEGENLKCINTNKVLQSNTAPKYLSKKNTLIFDDKFALNSLWYHHTYRWPSPAQVERGHVLETCRGMK